MKDGEILKIKPSKFNFTIEIDKNTSAIVNTFTGAIDIFSNEKLKQLHMDFDISKDKEYFYQRQYLIDEDIDEDVLMGKFSKDITNYKRETTSLKAVIILTFDCNLKCIYCWQQDNVDKSHIETITIEKIDKIFESISEITSSLEHVKNDIPIIQLFGGEPLLYKNRDIVEYILKMCNQKKWHSQITTNGSQLKKFMDIFEEHGVGEVQVTVDGSSEIHEQRRVGSKYKDIMDSIDLLLQTNKTYVKLRVNVDDDNIDSISFLSDEIIDRKWYTNNKFYAYIAPLRDSTLEETKLIKDRNNLLRKFIEKREQYPQLEIFDVLGWNGYEAAKILENTGSMPYPKGYICDVNMNNFVFTPNGEIHLCSEEAHDSNASIGRYWPELYINKDSFVNKYDKNPFEFYDCKTCNLLPICGGGCQMFEKEEEYKNEYCKSVKDCFTLGIKNYIETEGLI